MKLKLYFGASLIATAVDAVGVVKKFHNRYWIPPSELPSGKTMAAMYKAMKRQLLKVYSQEQGYNTLHKKPEWKDGIWSLEEKAAKMEEYRADKFADWESKGDLFFLPDFWLAFLLTSLPMTVYFPGKTMTLSCMVPPAAVAPSGTVPVPPKKVRRAEAGAGSRVRGTAGAATNNQVMDLTGEESNTFTMVHRREREVMSPHDDALRALTSELDQLKTNLAILGSLPGHAHHPAMEQLHGRLVAVILEVSRLQQLQTEHVTRGTSIRSPAPVAGTPVPATTAPPPIAAGFLDATQDYAGLQQQGVDDNNEDQFRLFG